MTASKEGTLRGLLASRTAVMGLGAWLPWDRLEELGRQWIRFGRVMNLTGARELGALSEQVAEGLQCGATVD